MTHAYCMTSNCALAKDCARYEDDAGKYLLTRTYADFSEELIRKPDGSLTTPSSCLGRTRSRLHTRR